VLRAKLKTKLISYSRLWPGKSRPDVQAAGAEIVNKPLNCFPKSFTKTFTVLLLPVLKVY